MANNVKKSWVDPLTYREIKIGDRVRLDTENDITLNLIVEDIHDDDSILLKKPDAKVISSHTDQSVVLYPSVSLDTKTLNKNDLVLITDKNGKTLTLKVEYIINKEFLLLGPADRNQKNNFLKKLKLNTK